MEWIKTSDRLPDDSKLKKYKVKMKVGSISQKEVETVVLGGGNNFRFHTGDWQVVTHWTESPPEEDK